MTWAATRREALRLGFLTGAGVTAAALIGMPRRSEALEHVTGWLNGCSLPTTMPITEDPRVQEMLKRAVDAAIAAGAEYADARLTHSRERDMLGVNSGNAVVEPKLPSSFINRSIQIIPGVPKDTEEISVGVRAFRNGYWGFASGPAWTVDEGIRLGTEAGRQATVVAKGKPTGASLAPTAVVTNGKWETPIEIDPFSLHPSQIKDIFIGIGVYAIKHPKIDNVGVGAIFSCQDKAFCSSLGSTFAQRTRVILPQIGFRYAETGESFQINIFHPKNSMVAAGFEVFDEQRARDAVQPTVDEFEADPFRNLPLVSVDVGRYETVFSAYAIGWILGDTLLPATQWDRMLGYEANATGTSYLNEPETMLGQEMVASDVISFNVNRSTPRALATVQWDDEGVVPQPTPIVTNGRLVNVQTNREGAAWVSAAKPEIAARSSGSMAAPCGVDRPMIHPGNVHMTAGQDNLSFMDMIKSMKKGLAVTGTNAHMDMNLSTGFAHGGGLFEITNGEVVGRVGTGIGIMFRTPELWKGFKAVGGEASRDMVNLIRIPKGNPPQLHNCTVSSVALWHPGLTYIDPSRKG